jgi:hypothetical protein
MSRRKRSNQTELERLQNKANLDELLVWLIPDGQLFTKASFHGNTKWMPEQLAKQAVLWAWQDTRNVTDAFAITLEICEDLKIPSAAKNYTPFMNALEQNRELFGLQLGQRFQALAEDVAGRFWRDGEWALFGFDGSRVTVPRTISNETEFCAPNYGHGKTAKYRKKKTKGMRRRQNKMNKPQPQTPQVWITMIWHMNLRLPWTWRLGPSNSSERGHVMEILEHEEFPEKSLFCGDAGFVGYDFWSSIMATGADFLVRVGANVSLLSERADIKQLGDGMVLCWPKGKMNSGAEPLRLRLVKIKIGKTTMWMLTSVLDRKKLPKKKIIKYYKMRWGLELEYRGLKQTIDKHTLRCRNSDRVYVELDWSSRAMAFAELIALREQIPHAKESRAQSKPTYNTKERSLANTMRALRSCMRNLNKDRATKDLPSQLSRARVQKYRNHTDKRARFLRKNPDKKPLGEPTVRKINRHERESLREINEDAA